MSSIFGEKIRRNGSNFPCGLGKGAHIRGPGYSLTIEAYGEIPSKRLIEVTHASKRVKLLDIIGDPHTIVGELPDGQYFLIQRKPHSKVKTDFPSGHQIVHFAYDEPLPAQEQRYQSPQRASLAFG